MLHPNFVIFGAILALIGTIGYTIDTVKGKTRPNRVSWFLWALAPLIAFAGELQEGVGIHALMTFMAGFGPLLVFLASFINRKSYWKITQLDWWCGALSLATLVLWAITRDANIAIFLSIVTDGLAAVPTIIKAYKEPESESAIAFLFSGLGAAITLLALDHWDFAHWAFPAYIFTVCMLIFGLIVYPRKREVVV